MSSCEPGCGDRRPFWRVEGMIRRVKPALKIPALLMVVVFLSGTSVTLAQCDVHEDAKLTAPDAAADDWFGFSVSNIDERGPLEVGCKVERHHNYLGWHS